MQENIVIFCYQLLFFHIIMGILPTTHYIFIHLTLIFIIKSHLCSRIKLAFTFMSFTLIIYKRMKKNYNFL